MLCFILIFFTISFFSLRIHVSDNASELKNFVLWCLLAYFHLFIFWVWNIFANSEIKTENWKWWFLVSANISVDYVFFRFTFFFLLFGKVIMMNLFLILLLFDSFVFYVFSIWMSLLFSPQHHPSISVRSKVREEKEFRSCIFFFNSSCFTLSPPKLLVLFIHIFG